MSDAQFAALDGLHLSAASFTWCCHCRMSSVNYGAIFAFTAHQNGPRRVGRWAFCEECGRTPHDGTPDTTTEEATDE